MSGFTLLKGMTFDWSGTTFRIERLQPAGDLLLERVTDGHVVPITRERLLEEYGQGRVSAQSPKAGTPGLDVLPTYSRPLDELSPQVQLQWARRWRYVQALVEQGDVVFTPAAIGPVIAAIASQIGDPHPPSGTTLYRWYRSYRTHRDTRALIPRMDLRGSRNLKQDEEILRLAEEATQEAFHASPRATVQSVYVRLVAKIEAENRHRMPVLRLKRPSLRSVYRLLKRRDTYDLTVLREGRAAAEKRLRLSGPGTTTTHILERAEIDHTPLDLFLIDEKTWLPLGRPTLTVVIDHFSRMLLGYYLSFESPSAAAVVGALRHAILPKEATIPALPKLSIEHQWPCYGCPEVLVVDNGLEFHGKDLESVCFDLNIRIQFCPKHQPRFKGTVERYLKTINYFFAHQLPGTSFARLHQRGDYNPEQHALLTLAEFKHLFEKWVIDVYAQQKHRTLGVTPWSKWQEGLVHRAPRLPTDVRDLQRRIGLVDECRLRRDGIWLKGIQYKGDELQPILSAYGESVPVRVLFDPDDLGAIQVWGPEHEAPITVFAVDQEYARNLTMHQNRLIRAQLREQGAASENREALQRAKHDLAITVQELMDSRKQRNRRKGAAIRGTSSTKPNAEVIPSPPPASKKLIRPKRPTLSSESDDLPTARYASFRVER
jgi:putative transposase